MIWGAPDVLMQTQSENVARESKGFFQELDGKAEGDSANKQVETAQAVDDISRNYQCNHSYIYIYT